MSASLPAGAVHRIVRAPVRMPLHSGLVRSLLLLRRLPHYLAFFHQPIAITHSLEVYGPGRLRRSLGRFHPGVVPAVRV